MVVNSSKKDIHNVITVSQQYGSNGSNIAAMLALKLGWQLRDHEILAQVAHRLGIPQEEAALYDEHAYSLVDRLLLYLQFATTEAMEAWAKQCVLPLSPHSQEQLYHQALQHVVETIACTGNVVIVGHGAGLLLANRPNVLHVRVVAPLAQRVHSVMQRELLDEMQALARIQQKDRSLARYLQSQYHRHVNDPLLDDLVINSGNLDAESQVNMICVALQSKTYSIANNA